jgi:hypothetical protein
MLREPSREEGSAGRGGFERQQPFIRGAPVDMHRRGWDNDGPRGGPADRDGYRQPGFREGGGFGGPPGAGGPIRRAAQHSLTVSWRVCVCVCFLYVCIHALYIYIYIYIYIYLSLFECTCACICICII